MTAPGPIEREIATAIRGATAQAPTPETTELQFPSNAENNHEPPRNNPQQHFVTILTQRRSAVTWMLQDLANNGQKGLFARTVRNLLHRFASSYKSNIAKEGSWWRNRTSLMELNLGRARLGGMNGYARRGRMRQNVKALSGKGRKRAAWVTALRLSLMT